MTSWENPWFPVDVPLDLVHYPLIYGFYWLAVSNILCSTRLLCVSFLKWGCNVDILWIYITNIHQFTAGWLIQRSFLTTAPFWIWFGMMIPTDEHIFQGVKSPTTKPLVICLMGEFLSTGMVELGIVGVSAITMNHNDGYWIYYDLLWFLQQNAGWKRLFFTLPPPGIPGEDTWDFRLCPVDLPAIFTAPWPFRHCGRLHGKIHENPPFVDRWFSHWNINLCIDDFPLHLMKEEGMFYSMVGPYILESRVLILLLCAISIGRILIIQCLWGLLYFQAIPY